MLWNLGAMRPATPVTKNFIDTLDLSHRSHSALAAKGIRSKEDILKLTANDFRYIKNVGRISLEEIREKLLACGVWDNEMAKITRKEWGF